MISIMQPLASIIIVNWNARQYLEKCIKSLLAQTHKNFEIILVDNASTDDSVEFVERNFPQVNIIKNKENVGFAKGNNIGIENSKGDLLAFFNPDAVADKEWLSKLVSVIESSDKIGGVAGKLYYLDNKYGKNAVFCTWSKIDPYSANPTNFFHDEPISQVDYLTGAAMLLKRDVINKVGLLDTDYFLYFEETDLCARIIRAGYELIYVPNAIAWHAVSPSSSSDKKIYFMERNRFRFAVKNFDSSYIPIFITIYLAESLMIFFRDIKKNDFVRTKIRLRALGWNLINFGKTLNERKKAMSFLRKHHQIKSYNNSLPLRYIKTRE